MRWTVYHVICKVGHLQTLIAELYAIDGGAEKGALDFTNFGKPQYCRDPSYYTLDSHQVY